MIRKKILAILILVAIVVQIVPCASFATDESQSNSVYENSKPVNQMDVFNSYGLNQFYSYEENGTANYAGNTALVAGTDSMGASHATTLAGILTFIPYCISCLMTATIHSGTAADQYSTTPEGIFTVENLVFNTIELFDANYFVRNSNIANTTLKDNVQLWYAGVRVIAIAASLITLIYMGIRMGISSAASDKAKYKRMLYDWLVSFVLIFVLHYIIVFITNISASLTYIFTANADQISLEQNIIQNNISYINASYGWATVAQTVVYFVIVFYQIRFFLMYMKRLFAIGFLIVISPLITITYAIDRAGDSKSQVFNTWFREIAVNICIQPLHALLYMVFIYSAGAIAEAAPLIAIAFLMALSRGEKIVKGIFNLRGLNTIHSMSETFKLRRGGA